MSRLTSQPILGSEFRKLWAYWAGGATLTIMAFALLRVVNNRTVAAAREQLL